MSESFGVVILNRYPEIARKFLLSLKPFHTVLPDILVVCDRHTEPMWGATTLSTDDAFIYARNANRGIDYFKGKDIILCNDDLECVEKDFFWKLADIANRFKQCGLISPLIDGGVGNWLQQFPADKVWNNSIRTEMSIAATVCFPCVYLKRTMLDEIGPLDESFVGYGFDDDDYCVRARDAGWWTMITRQLHIKHGSGGTDLKRGENWSVSFAKETAYTDNREIYRQKHLQKKIS